MAHHIICVGCRLRQPLVAAVEGEAVRAAWTAALALTHGQEAAEAIAQYIDWFAPPDREPQARTVARVLSDLASRMAAGQVSVHKIARPAPVSAWIDAMRLIVGHKTEASRPLSTNGYLAGIVWNRAAERVAERPASLPCTQSPSHDAPLDARLARSHLLGHLRSLRAVLAGATDGATQESLRRQIHETECQLELAGATDGRSDAD